MTTTEAMILILGTLFLTVSILLLLILNRFVNLFGMFIRDALQRQTAHLSAAEDGFVLEDEETTELTTGLYHYEEDDYIFAEQSRQEMLELGLKRGEDG